MGKPADDASAARKASPADQSPRPSSIGLQAMYIDHQMPPRPISYDPWSVGLCNCFSHCGRFCISCWCPCITFGQVSEIISRGSSSCCVNGGVYLMLMGLMGWGWIYSCYYRGKMRKVFKLQGGSCNDCLIHFCCEPCALTQMYHELHNRGFDVSSGWHPNLEDTQTRANAMAPPTMQTGMNP